MASLFRQQYLDRSGNPKRTRIWYCKYRDASGRQIRKSLGTANKTRAQQLLAEITKQVEAERQGRADRTDRIVEIPLGQSLQDWYDSILANGADPEWASKSHYRVQTVLTALGVDSARGVDSLAIERWLAAGVASGTFGAKTRNHYLAALKGFFRWMVDSRPQRIVSSPVANLRSVRVTDGTTRRSLTAEEVGKLIRTAGQAATVEQLSGPDREALYLTAVWTGLRAGELATLTAESLQLDARPPVVTLGRADTKNKQQARIPLHPELVAHLRGWLPGRPSGPLWPGGWHLHAAAMVRADLQVASIPASTPDGVVDFHALRHSAISLFARGGVGAKELQELARHSSPVLTLGTYTHTDLDRQAAALAALPPLTGQIPQAGKVWVPAGWYSPDDLIRMSQLSAK